ncbi:MAG: hypothetical protein SPE84_10275, partial [Bullifex sp.]|nr:hypothetical protein [Bullifex sp.]
LDNVWQKTGLAEKKPLELNAYVYEHEGESDSVDAVRAILGDDHAISYSVTVEDSFTGKVLRSLDDKELEALTATIKAKCYSDDEIRAFLSAPLTDETIIYAMKGTAELFKELAKEMTLAVTSCLPEMDISPDASDAEKEFGQFWNDLVGKVKAYVESQIEGFFNPVISFLSADTLTNADYITCQLTVNLVDGLLSSIEDVFTAASAELSNSRSIDLKTVEGRTEIGNTIQKAGVSVAMDAVSSVCHNLLTTVACMDQITNIYGHEVRLPSISTLLEAITGGKVK